MSFKRKWREFLFGSEEDHLGSGPSGLNRCATSTEEINEVDAREDDPPVVISASQCQQESPLPPLPPPESSSQQPLEVPGPCETQLDWLHRFAKVHYGRCQTIDPEAEHVRCPFPAAYLWNNSWQGKKMLLPVYICSAREGCQSHLILPQPTWAPRSKKKKCQDRGGRLVQQIQGRKAGVAAVCG